MLVVFGCRVESVSDGLKMMAAMGEDTRSHLYTSNTILRNLS